MAKVIELPKEKRSEEVKVMLSVPYNEEILKGWEMPVFTQPKLDGVRCRTYFEFGVCDMEIESKTTEPPPVQRGNIARTYYYMDHAYPGYGIINDDNRALFQEWAVGDPVDAWECERVKRVEEVQGNGNGFVKYDCIVRNMW